MRSNTWNHTVCRLRSHKRLPRLADYSIFHQLNGPKDWQRDAEALRPPDEKFFFLYPDNLFVMLSLCLNSLDTPNSFVFLLFHYRFKMIFASACFGQER